ncbi:ATP-binding protein [Pseudoalteromonas sp. SS15]|uniref:ATP-binding protein n=1 Tax=Pseudoalteromonas sp. SS15 TaxID=3139393 RepID=UPI003BAD256E
MPTLNIKTRILLFVVIFEILAYSSIVLFSNVYYSSALSNVKEQEIIQTFKSSANKIDHTISLMEQSAFNLAQHGLSLYLEHNKSNFDKAELKQKFSDILEQHFSFFELALGGGVWFEPMRVFEDTQYFGPYVYRDNKRILFSWELSGEQYDYHSQDWYQLGKQAAKNALPVVWTHPYVDEAGSLAPMMTVDAPIILTNGDMIGMATVDWSLSELTAFLETVKITDNSSPLLIHKASNRIISFPLKSELVMQTTPDEAWFKPLYNDSSNTKFNTFRSLPINGKLYDLYFLETKSGFILGFFSPHKDIDKEVRAVSQVTLLGGAIIGITFIVLIIFIMKHLFKPFDLVLSQIKGSIKHTDNEKVTVQNIVYDEQNEFTPIITELNFVYQQVNTHIAEINQANTALTKTQNELDKLNIDLELKVKTRTDELNHKTEEALKALSELQTIQKKLIEQEKHASLGRLVAGIAHEINTPVGVAITAASFVEDEVVHLEEKLQSCQLTKHQLIKVISDFKEGCFILKSNLHRTAELVASFKQVSVDQSSELLRKIELNAYLEDVIRTLKPRIKNSSHKVHLEPNPVEIEVLCSPGAIAQVITNIIENALVHAFNKHESGEVNVLLSQSGNEVSILISDNGQGMPSDVLECIFDPFFTTNRENGGSGLGMHLVYNIISQQLNGTINCSSIVGKGTQFIIKFPLNSTN